MTESYVLSPVTAEHIFSLYFFHVSDGKSYPDLDGTELPGLEAARQEACRVISDILEDRVAFPGHEWRVDITDAAGQALHAVTFALQETSYPIAA